MTKETVLKLLESLPGEFELDLLFEKLIFVEKVEVGLKDIEKGDVVNHEDVKKMFNNK